MDDGRWSIVLETQMNKNLLFILPLLLLLAACGGSSEPETGVTASDVWGRPSPSMAMNGAFYMNIRNNGPEADKLIGASSDACNAIELHESVMQDDVMQMVHVGEIDLPVGQTVELKVGGLHVMCLGKQADFTPGAEISLTLFFANAGEMAAVAEIRSNQ